MFTQCPDCGTVFRVTATVLRAARGQVRCGVCDATFDALQYLTEESDLEGDEGGASPAGGAGAQDAASPAADVGAVASFDDGSDEDEDHDDEREDEERDDGDVEEERGDDGAGETRDDDRAERGTRSVERYYDDTGEHEGFPLEQLDDPIDVIATPGSGPAPEFPPFAPDDVAASPSALQDVSVSGHYEIAIDDVEPASAASTLASAPAAGTASASFDQFVHRAGRNTPSADEDRALAEIAAALARRAQSAPSAGGDGELADGDMPSLEIELLDASVAENIVLSGQDDVSDSALEFNLPVEDWDRVFVPDEAAATIPPLDPSLAEAQSLALADDGDGDADGAVDIEGDLDIDVDADADADVRDSDRDVGRREPRASAGDDDIEIDLDDEEPNADVEHRDEDEDDGDLDPADLRERAASPQAAAPAFERPEDPLSRTDEFPPLRVTPAEEATAGVAGTPDAKPRTGVPLDEFDALVAAAAARAAAQVAARVGGATPSGTPAASLPAGTATEGDASTPGAARGGAAFRDPLVDALDGTAESAWFTARRDLAPEGAAITSAESPETIQFDAQRFQAIVRGRRRRPWWRTALYVVGSLVLTLALGAQAVHYWRESLAQHTMFGPPLRALYARLGLPLEPRWNLAAFDVKQWGATADMQPGTLRVRASIVNRAARAQPHPMLRVTLLDRFSAKVARREFTPAEYLPGRTAPTDMLAAGARVDADLVIADPGSDAVGFELDVCLKRRGVLECAGDAKLALP